MARIHKNLVTRIREMFSRKHDEIMTAGSRDKVPFQTQLKMSKAINIDAELKKHSDGSDCIGCDRRPLPVEESQPIDLDCSEEFASQSPISPDASDSPQLSEDEDVDMAMEDDPEDYNGPEDDPQYEAWKRHEEMYPDIKWKRVDNPEDIEKVKGNYDEWAKKNCPNSIMERNRSIVP